MTSRPPRILKHGRVAALLVRAVLTQRRPIPSLPAGQRHDRAYNVAGSMNLASST